MTTSRALAAHEGLPAPTLVVEDHLVISRQVVEERKQFVVPHAWAAVKDHERFAVPDHPVEVGNAIDGDEALSFR